MQKKNKTILSTRPLEEVLLAKAAKRGIKVDMVSFIDTTPVQSEALKEQVKNTAAQPGNIVFTSMNAVEAVADYKNTIEQGWKIFCIGNTTRKLAEQYFGSSSIAGTADSAEGLADVIIDKKNITAVTFFCGDQRRDELPDQLKKAKISVTEIVTYYTKPTPVKIEQPYDGILYFSPSAVHSFFSVNTIHPGTTLFAIGNSTAEALKQYAENKIITGDKPGKENLLEKAIEYFSKW